MRFDNTKEYNYFGSSTDAIDEKGNFIDSVMISGSKPPSRAKQVLTENTIVMTNLEGNRGMPAIVTSEVAGDVLSSAFIVVKPNENIDISYLKLILHSKHVQDYLRNHCSTGLNPAQACWGLDELSNITINLPDIKQQQRTLVLIQEKIEVIKSKIKDLEEEKESNSLKNIIDRTFQEKVGLDIPDIESVPSSHYLVDLGDVYNDRLDFNFINYRNNIENKDISNTMKVKRIAKIVNTTRVKKGTKIYGQSIAFKEILQYSGKIKTPINYMDYVVEGDRASFQGCDVMFSKFNPQFGNNILVTKENDKCIGSLEFWGLELDKEKILPQYFIYAMSTKQILVSFCYLVTGAKLILDGNGRSRVTPSQFYDLNIPVPKIEIQQDIIDEIESSLEQTRWYNHKINELQSIIDNDLDKYILNGYDDNLFTIQRRMKVIE